MKFTSKVLLSLAVLGSMTADDAVVTAQSLTYTGFLADMLCTRLEIAPDQSNMILTPIEHSVFCQLLPACVRSGFGLTQNIGTNGTNEYRISAAFDESGSDFIADLLGTMDPQQNDLRVKVVGTYQGVTPAGETPEIVSRDGERSWPAMNNVPMISVDSLEWCNYVGPDARMTVDDVCDDTERLLDLLNTAEGRATLASEANLCMRDEISVGAQESNYVIFPDGCADHATFQDVKRADTETCNPVNPECDDTPCDTDTCSLECLDVCGNPLVLDGSGKTASTCCLDPCGIPYVDACGFPVYDACGNPLDGNGMLCPAASIAENQVNECLDACGNPVSDACGNPVEQCCLDICGNPLLDPCGFPWLDPCGNPASDGAGTTCTNLGANVCLPQDCDEETCENMCVDVCGNPISLSNGQTATTCCLDPCGFPLVDPCGFPYLDPCGNPTDPCGSPCPTADIGVNEINQCVDVCGNPLTDACGNPSQECCLDPCGNPFVDPCGFPFLDACGNPTDSGGMVCTGLQLGQNLCDGKSGGDQCEVACLDVCGNPLVLSNGQTASVCCLDPCGNPMVDPCGFPYLDPCGNPIDPCGNPCPTIDIRENEINQCIDVCGNPLADACGNPFDTCCLDPCGNPFLDPCGFPYTDRCGNPTDPSGVLCTGTQLGQNLCEEGDYSGGGAGSWRRGRRRVLGGMEKNVAVGPMTKGTRKKFVTSHRRIADKHQIQTTTRRHLAGHEGCHKDCVDVCGNPLLKDGISGAIAETCCLDICGNPLLDGCGFPFADACGNPTTGYGGTPCPAAQIGEYDADCDADDGECVASCVDVCGNPLVDACGNPQDQCCLDLCGNPYVDPCGFPFVDPCGNPADPCGNPCPAMQIGQSSCDGDACELTCIDVCGNPLSLSTGATAKSCCLDACGSPYVDPCGFPFLDACGNPTDPCGNPCPTDNLGANEINECVDVCGNPISDACGNPVDVCCLDGCGSPYLDPCGFPFLDACGNPTDPCGSVCPNLGENVCDPNGGGGGGGGTCSIDDLFPPASGGLQCEGLVSACELSEMQAAGTYAGAPGFRRRRRMQANPNVPLYTPLRKDIEVKIPSSPPSGILVRKELLPEHEGVIGLAVNGVPIVFEHPGEGPNTLLFDSCGGHGDLDNRYHYHLPPVCLLRSLGGTVPRSSDWWLAPNPENQWPGVAKATGSKSPLVGWALDGFPIFGPYNPDNGELVIPAGAAGGDENCGENVLDECNGMVLENGMYAYFLTPTAPFVPPCLMGEVAADAFADNGLAGGELSQCPIEGTDPLAGTEICDEKTIVFSDETCPGNEDRQQIRNCFELAASSFVGEPTCAQLEAAISESKSCFVGVGCCGDFEATIAAWKEQYPSVAECNFVESDCLSFEEELTVVDISLTLDSPIDVLVPDTKSALRRSLATILEVDPSRIRIESLEAGSDGTTSEIEFRVAHPSEDEAMALFTSIDSDALATDLSQSVGLAVSSVETEQFLAPTAAPTLAPVELWPSNLRVGLGVSMAGVLVLFGILYYLEDFYCYPSHTAEEETALKEVGTEKPAV